MQEYTDNSTRLGWLLNPQDQQVEIFRRDSPKKVLSVLTQMEAENVLTGFALTRQNIL